MTDFATCFWNESLQDFSGFEIICKRLKTGKRAWKEYVDYLKHRAQIQESYGKSLMKIAKFEGGKEDIGTLRKTWDELSSHTESVGVNNLSLSMALQEEGTSQSKKIEEDNEKRKKILAEIRKLQNAQKSAVKRVEAMKRVYYAKSKQSDQIGQSLLVEMGRANIQPKEIDKLKAKHNRCMDAAEQADTAYKDTLNFLDDIRVMWEKETVKACQALQELEEHRAKCLRDSLWHTSNLFSTYCVKEDDHQEQIRKVIENLDIQGDIRHFIKDNNTGCIRPKPIPYEPYRRDGQQIKETPNEIANLKCKPEEAHNEPIYASVDKKQKTPKGVSYENEIYSTDNVDMEIYESADLYEKYAWRVLETHEANGPFEISLDAQDYVLVTNQTNRDWWQVETLDGRKGYFPSQYLEFGAHIDVV